MKAENQLNQEQKDNANTESVKELNGDSTALNADLANDETIIAADDKENAIEPPTNGEIYSVEALSEPIETDSDFNLARQNMQNRFNDTNNAIEETTNGETTALKAHSYKEDEILAAGPTVEELKNSLNDTENAVGESTNGESTALNAVLKTFKAINNLGGTKNAIAELVHTNDEQIGKNGTESGLNAIALPTNGEKTALNEDLEESETKNGSESGLNAISTAEPVEEIIVFKSVHDIKPAENVDPKDIFTKRLNAICAGKSVNEVVRECVNYLPDERLQSLTAKVQTMLNGQLKDFKLLRKMEIIYKNLEAANK